MRLAFAFLSALGVSNAALRCRSGDPVAVTRIIASAGDGYLAIDDDETSAWVSGTGSPVHWLAVDLGEQRVVHEVQALWHREFRPLSYELQGSPDANADSAEAAAAAAADEGWLRLRTVGTCANCGAVDLHHAASGADCRTDPVADRIRCGSDLPALLKAV